MTGDFLGFEKSFLFLDMKNKNKEKIKSVVNGIKNQDGSWMPKAIPGLQI